MANDIMKSVSTKPPCGKERERECGKIKMIELIRIHTKRTYYIIEETVVNRFVIGNP